MDQIKIDLLLRVHFRRLNHAWFRISCFYDIILFDVIPVVKPTNRCEIETAEICAIILLLCFTDKSCTPWSILAIVVIWWNKIEVFLEWSREIIFLGLSASCLSKIRIRRICISYFIIFISRFCVICHCRFWIVSGVNFFLGMCDIDIFQSFYYITDLTQLYLHTMFSFGLYYVLSIYLIKNG